MTTHTLNAGNVIVAREASFHLGDSVSKAGRHRLLEALRATAHVKLAWHPPRRVAAAAAAGRSARATAAAAAALPLLVVVEAATVVSVYKGEREADREE